LFADKTVSHFTTEKCLASYVAAESQGERSVKYRFTEIFIEIFPMSNCKRAILKDPVIRQQKANTNDKFKSVTF
jgi:hypothetical protein